MNTRTWAAFCWVLLVAASATAADLGMTVGTAELKSAGPLAFGPNGILFVGDPLGAAIFAIDTQDTAGNADSAKFAIPGIDGQVAGLLGTTADEILIQDIAVNPASGAVYLSVSRGRGPDAAPVIVRVDESGDLKVVSLEKVPFAKAELTNAPENRVTGEGRRRGNQRLESITDLMYLDGKVYVAGLSNEEFASKLRSIPFPFQRDIADTSIEIFHGAHGRWETASPVRTFTAYNVDDTANLLAAYQCTPLVKIPIDMLVPGEKVTGKTVAELGNRNRPLDMVVYEKDGEDFLLMANNARGLMKVSLDEISAVEAITERVPDIAGLEYDTIENADGIVQLDRLNKDNVVVLIQSDNGHSLSTMALP
jgi:hypothetical protein